MDYLLNLSYEEKVFFIKSMEKYIEDKAIYDESRIKAGGGIY